MEKFISTLWKKIEGQKYARTKREEETKKKRRRRRKEDEEEKKKKIYMDELMITHKNS